MNGKKLKVEKELVMISLKTVSRQVSGEIEKLSTRFQCSRFWVGI